MFRALLLVTLGVVTHGAALPRRGVRRAAAVVVPGLNEAAFARMVAKRPELALLELNAAMRTPPDSPAFDHAHALGLELATGCPAARAPGRVTLFDVWRGAGRAVGAATTSCLLDPTLAPLAVSTETGGALERAAALARGAGATPDVWLGGRSAGLDAASLGRPPRCAPAEAAALAACAAPAAPRRPVVGLFGDPTSLFARRCQFVTATGPSATQMATAGALALEKQPAGWLFVLLLHGVDRAAHANSTAALDAALEEAGATLAALAAHFDRDRWDGAALLLVSPYDCGEFEGGLFGGAPFHSSTLPGLLRARAPGGALDLGNATLAPADFARLLSPGLNPACNAPDTRAVALSSMAGSLAALVPHPRPAAASPSPAAVALLVSGAAGCVLLIAGSAYCICRLARRQRLLGRNGRRGSRDGGAGLRSPLNRGYL